MTLKEHINRIFTPPRFDEPNKIRIAGILRAISVVTFCGLCIILVDRLIGGAYGQIVPLSLITVLVAVSIVAEQLGYLDLAGGLYSWSVLFFLIYMALQHDGLHDTVVLAIPGIIVAAALLLKTRQFVAFSFVALFSVLGTGFFELIGVLHNAYSQKTNLADIIDLGVILGVTAIAIRQLSENLNRSFAQVLASETEIRNQSEQLRRSELRYRTLFENANDAILIMVEGKFVECNSMAVKMFGCRNASDLVDRYPWEFSPSNQPDGIDSQEKARTILGAALEGNAQRFYWKHRRLDGTEFDAEVSLNCPPQTGEKLVQAMVTDITERRKAEEAIRKSEEKFHKIFHASPVPMSISRLRDGLYLDVNESFLRYMEFGREEVIGKTALDLHTWEDKADLARVANTLMQIGSIQDFEGKYRTHTGKVGYSIVSAEIIDLDGEPSILGVSIDITERRRAEEALHLQVSALESTANSVVITDTEGNIQWANPAFSKMTGYGLDEVIGSNPRVLKSGLHDSDFYKVLWHTVLSGEVWHGEITNKRKDGTLYEEEMTITPVKGGDGRILNFVAVKQDVTQRKRAEEILKRYELLSENARDIILIARKEDGQILEANKAAQITYGYSREELLALRVHDLRASETLEQLPDHLDRADKEGALLQTIHRRKDGSRFPVEVSSAGAIINQSRLLIAIIRDITERKRVEDALKESEQLYRVLVTASPDAITVTDQEGRAVFASSKTAILFGEDNVEDILGRSVIEWVAPEDRDRAAENIKRLYTGDRRTSRQYTMLRKDGSRFTGEVNTEPLPGASGKARGFVAFVRDVTERKRAEMELEEKEQRYRALFDLSPGGIVLTDLQGEILAVNAAACRTHGYTREELVGANVRIFMPPEEFQYVEANLEQLKNGRSLEHEVTNVKKDGTRCNIELRETLITLPDGRKGILSITNDITARKAAEAALLESEKRYRNLVEISPDAIVIHQDFKVKYANPAASRLMGLPEDMDLVGRSVFEVVQSERHSDLRERYRQMVEENKFPPFAELKLVRPDGQWIEVETSAIPTIWEGRPAAQVVIHDLSERKKAEAALLESEERFRSLSRVTFEGIMVHENGIIIDANQRFAELFGFDNSDQLVGKHGLDVLPMTAESRMLIRQGLESRSDSPFEISVLRPDGTTFPAETQSRKAMYRGRFASVVTVRDITERKLAEKALAESEERFRALVQNSSDVVSIHDEKGTFSYVAPSVSRVMGYTPEFLIGRSAFEFIHPDDLPIVRSDYRDMITNRADNIPTQFRFRTADGTWKFLESLGTNLLHAPSVRGFVLNTRDVTERKIAEAALKESEERYRLLIENSTDVISEINADGKFIYASPNCLKILGYRPSELLQKDAFEKVHPEDAPKVVEKFQEQHASEIFRYQHINGSWRWFESSGQRYRTSSGEERLVVISRDVTERMKAEGELERYRAQLERFSEHLETVLDEERKRISREIHDELGQLLTILKFDLSWLRLRSGTKNKQASEKLKSMEGTLSQALASVKRISRELRPQQLDALGLVGAIQLDVNQVERKAGLSARLKIDPTNLSIEGHLSMTIYRVFNEILTNIVRHAHARNVSISLKKSVDEVVLKVHDDGRGITKQELEGTLSLGLVGMRERVRQWHGKLSIVGRKDKGTTVVAQFPLQKDPIEGSKP